MALCYEDWKDPTVIRKSKTPIHEWEPPKVMGMWKFHVGNRYFLEFMARWGDFVEQGQARKELVICQRKLDWWKRHRSWRQPLADAIEKEMRGTWHER